MKHQITPSQLKVGMYITGFDQAWINVPFWRRRFLVTDERMRVRVMDSGVDAIIIDDELGIGPGLAVVAAPAVAAPSPASPPAAEQSAPVVHERRSQPRRSGAVNELDRARQTVARSKAAMIEMFTQARLGHAVEVEALEPLVEEIAASVARDRTAIISVTRLKNKNEYTYLHSVAVCALMMNLARQIGMSTAEVRQAGFAGMLHDVGKMAIPETVLDKPGALDAEERRLIESHPEQGHRLLQSGGTVDNTVLDVCLHHHERMDGTGYPHGLDEHQLSVFARMGAICDVYDAITSARAYKEPWPPGQALTRMFSWEGHFDQRLLRAFVASLGIFPIGALVRLRSNRLAIVLREDPVDPTTPVVRVFFQVENMQPIPIEDLVSDASSDPILQGEIGHSWFGDDWPALSRRVNDALLRDRVELAQTDFLRSACTIGKTAA